MTKRDDADHSGLARPSNADDWYGKTPPTATLEPPESASGAPGPRVVPLVQLFDMKAYNAQFDAKIAANPGGLSADQRKQPDAVSADQGDWLTKETSWKDGFKERLDYVDWGRDDTSSQACSSYWEHDWWKVRTDKSDDVTMHPSKKEGTEAKQNAQRKLAPWKRWDSPASSVPQAPRGSKQTAPVGGNDHVSVASSSGDRSAEAPWRQPDHSSFRPPAARSPPEDNEQTPWYTSPTPVAQAGALAPPAPTVSPGSVSPHGVSQQGNTGGAYTRPTPPAPAGSSASPVRPCFVSPHGASEQGSAGGAHSLADHLEDRDTTMSDRSSVFEATDKKTNKGKVPCNRCNEWFQAIDMLPSYREEHIYWSNTKERQMPGRTCVYCTFELMRYEHNERGFPPGEHPTLEQCWEEICTAKKSKSENRTAAHKKAIKQIDANQRADKKNGIFYFDEGSKKERRREDYKHLFGEHLIKVCAAGDLFSALTNFGDRMETLRQMTENVEKMEEEGAPAEARSKAYDDIEQAFHQDSAFADYDSDKEEEMRRTQDFNDQVVHSGNKEVEMNLYYMCAKHDISSYDHKARCGLFTSGKLWNRRGAAPEQTRAWYCGLERSEWDALIQRTYLVEAGAPNNERAIDPEIALNQAQREVGCKCRFRPFSERGKHGVGSDRQDAARHHRAIRHQGVDPAGTSQRRNPESAARLVQGRKKDNSAGIV